MRYGLEREFFVRNRETMELVPASKTTLPMDEGGILAEARGKARDDIVEAVYSLKAGCHRLKEKAEDLGLSIVRADLKTVDRETFIEALRHGGSKGGVDWQNLYGHPHHAHEDNEYLAGLHISATNQRTIRVDGKTRKYNSPWDFASFVRFMDGRFEEQIEQVNRKPGFYEIKTNGRIEYRSLPSTISLSLVIDAVQDWEDTG